METMIYEMIKLIEENNIKKASTLSQEIFQDLCDIYGQKKALLMMKP